MYNHVAEADRHYAMELGRESPEMAWVLSDRDVWYPNPFYTGPRQPHPEYAEYEERLEAEAEEDTHYDREQQMREDYESMVTPNPYGESPPGNPWG